MTSLLLSLGHGASACLVDTSTGHIIAAYENERLTGIKSDSQFPLAAINECLKFKYEEVKRIFVSHWGINPEEFIGTSSKYWEPGHIKTCFPNAVVTFTDRKFTHHDAHMASAQVFAGKEYTDDSVLGVVCDGFGNLGECLSIYTFKDGERELKFRHFGFAESLGLYYQYSTSFLGLKENQDEYKLLGYEAHIGDLLDKISTANLWRVASEQVNQLTTNILSKALSSATDPVVTIGALPARKLEHRRMLQNMLTAVNADHLSLHDKKIVVAFFTQTVVCGVMIKLVTVFSEKLGTNKLLLSGGVFMNVALNRSLINHCDKICIMPLCGDQGAPLGLYNEYMGNLQWPDHLFWGHRDKPWNTWGTVFGPSDVVRHSSDKSFWLEDSDESATMLAERLNQNQIVNLVCKSMEFGSRTLGNTSSLMLPTLKNVARINEANARSTVMPCAPVVRDQDLHLFFEMSQVDRVHKSLEYMICTIDYLPGVGETCLGAAHRKPFTDNIFTGRVQILKEETHPFLYHVLGQIDGRMLINTSFNYHGEPICFENFFETTEKQASATLTCILGE